MVNVSEICQFLEELAPLSLAESWDNVGLLLGRTGTEVHTLMTCLTLTERVAREAIRRDVQLIVVHHPVLFRGVKKITDAAAEGRMVLDLVEAGIAVYSPHTALDSAATGINQQLAEALGLQDIRALRELGPGNVAGSGRKGSYTEPVGREDFLARVSRVTAARFLEISWNGPDEVRQVGVACGSAAEWMNDAADAGCDTFITGEARFHAVLDSQSRRLNLVLTGHFASERPAVEWLADRITREFPGVNGFASTEDPDPLELWSNANQKSTSPDKIVRKA